ncbi:hypothetical protein SASPL_157850 [Salvia splendens]|uniref:WPP domain-containing protein n=1 Tax=Salvia splendens TaxID=180675 RepID=A0A8X8VU86_SALSN|nr:hypothetical protein SASPL_157850 [Salvia splendens]
MWPISQSTRLKLVERMAKNLVTPSIWSRKYGLLKPDGDGSSAVQLYAKESSRLMIDVIKRGPVAKADAELGILAKIKECDGTTFDISGDPRKVIDGEEAEILLKLLTEPGRRYTKIYIVAGRPEEEALEVMEMFSSALEGSKLHSLNLSYNALGEKGIRAFGALLKSQHDLEELYLINDGISEEAAMAVHELLPSTDKLKDFRCSSTRVESEGGIALATELGSCTHLKKLDLRDNMFGVDAGLALSKVLSEFSNLSEIYLSYLNLEDEGSIAIWNALKESAPSLEVLDMAGNEITARAAPVLASFIASKQFLTKLNLAENELKDEGAILIAKALEEGHGQLCEVDMNTNMIRRAGARCLALAVISKPSLKLLNINGNYISDEGIDEVRDTFKNCPTVLGPLDENDPDGEDYDEEEEQDGHIEHELESKLKGLEIKHED